MGVEIALGTALLASAGLLLHSFVKVMQRRSRLSGRTCPRGGFGAFRSELRTISQPRGVLSRSQPKRSQPSRRPGGGSDQRLARRLRIFRRKPHDFLRNRHQFQSLVLARPVAMIRSVTVGYFAASGTPLRAGRFFTDQESAPVRRDSASRWRIVLWPRQNPAAVVGRTLRQGDVTGPLITVAGVVEDARPGAVDREPPPLIYRPHAQWASGTLTLVVRTAHEPAALAPAIRSEIRKMDASLPIPGIRNMREIVSAAVAHRRFQMVLTLLFASARPAARRGRRLWRSQLFGGLPYAGYRTAHCARAMRSDVMRWVFSNGMRPVLIGLIVGLAGGIAIAKALAACCSESLQTARSRLGRSCWRCMLTSACVLSLRSPGRSIGPDHSASPRIECAFISPNAIASAVGNYTSH